MTMLTQTAPDELTAHLFRHEAGKMTATLTKLFGFNNVQIAEDIVQETMIAALQHWQRGIPPNPTAWLYRVAKNKALDTVRRRKYLTTISSEILYTEEQDLKEQQSSAFDALFEKQSIEDSTVQMLFACCHPALTEEMQIALALKTLCGLSIQEIANAFLTGKDTIEKRLYRAKERVRESGIAVEFPPESLLEERFDAVLHVIYLLFNEGYNSSNPDTLIRHDLAEEARRLCGIVLAHPRLNTPSANALMALMLFQTSRFQARLKENGEMLVFSKQDTSAWDGAFIAEAVSFLAASANGERISRYHLEAGIAAQYALAASFEEVHWAEIDKLYSALLALAPSPMARMNHIIARSYLHGAETGLEELSALETALGNHYLFHAVKGSLYKRLGRRTEANEAFRKALSLTKSAVEQEFLHKEIHGR